MDDRVCMHYVLDRLEGIVETYKTKDVTEAIQQIEEFKQECIYNLGVNQRLKNREPRPVEPDPVITVGDIAITTPGFNGVITEVLRKDYPKRYWKLEIFDPEGASVFTTAQRSKFELTKWLAMSGLTEPRDNDVVCEFMEIDESNPKGSWRFGRRAKRAIPPIDNTIAFKNKNTEIHFIQRGSLRHIHAGYAPHG